MPSPVVGFLILMLVTFYMSAAPCLSEVGSLKHRMDHGGKSVWSCTQLQPGVVPPSTGLAFCPVTLDSAWPVPHSTVDSALWVLMLITDHPGSRWGLEGTSFLPAAAPLQSPPPSLLTAAVLGPLGSAPPGGVPVQKSFRPQACQLSFSCAQGFLPHLLRRRY